MYKFLFTPPPLEKQCNAIRPQKAKYKCAADGKMKKKEKKKTKFSRPEGKRAYRENRRFAISKGERAQSKEKHISFACMRFSLCKSEDKRGKYQINRSRRKGSFHPRRHADEKQNVYKIHTL